jgi:hypothetical protein
LDETIHLAPLAAGLAVLVAAWLGTRWWRSLRARRRMARALRGERDAERILAASGFIVEARQARGVMRYELDGRRAGAEVRCDLLVRRGTRRYVAEVKTGALAPRLEHAPTRRQLIEYHLAFDVDGVLLVEPEASRVRLLELAPVRSRQPWWPVALGVLVGVVGTWFALHP